MELNVEINKLYSCSEWCKNILPENAVKNHIEILSEQSENCRNHLKYETNYYIKDNPTIENQYEFYPCEKDSKKLFIYIHGGFWQLLNMKSSTFMADIIVKNNNNFAAIGYDLCPNVSLKTIVNQIRIALKNIMNKYSYIDEIFICGHSAGAHLALLSVVFDGYENDLLFSDVENEKLKGLILLSGIYDVRPVCYTNNNNQLKLTDSDAWLLSPIRCLIGGYKFSNNFKLFLLAAENDSPAFIEQTMNLQELLIQTMSVDFLIVENKDHFTLCHEIGSVINYNVTDLILNFIK